METIKVKGNQDTLKGHSSRQDSERFSESRTEFRGVFKELRERLSAIAEAETKSAPNHQQAM